MTTSCFRRAFCRSSASLTARSCASRRSCRLGSAVSVEAEWTATTEATEALEAELPYSLRALLDAIMAALERKPFRQRIEETDAARELR